MRIGAFEIDEPVPELRDPHLLVSLRDWVDVGRVGTLALNTLEERLGAQDMGRLHRPGLYYDFTRYRPWRQRDGGITVPNAALRFARRPKGGDLVFLHSFEPHWRAEEFVESVLSVAESFGVERYCLIGAMYGRSPHTRPLGISGRATEPTVQSYFQRAGVRSSTYAGPTTIMILASEGARDHGMEMLHLLVQLPPYLRVEEDHRGQERLLRVLDGLYDFDLDLDTLAQEGAQQYQELGRLVRNNPQVRGLIRRLERGYDSEAEGQGDDDEPTLSSTVEDFLQELEDGDESSAP